MFVSIEEAGLALPDLLDKLAPGQEITITRNNEPVAKLTPIPRQSQKSRVAGSAVGQLIIVEDDDEHLKDFAEYM